MQKKIVYNFNRSNNFDIEWDNLKSQVKEYTKIRQTNGWEFFFLNEIIDNASNPHLKNKITNTKKIEPYDVSYENLHNQKIKMLKKMLMHNVFQRTNEFMT